MQLRLEFEIEFLQKSQPSNSLALNLKTMQKMTLRLMTLMTLRLMTMQKTSLLKYLSVGVMRRLPADVMVKLYYSLVYSYLTYALLALGRSGLSNAAKIECAHRIACKLLTDYNHRILTLLSIYDYFALLKAFNTTLKYHQYFKDKLSSHQPSHMHNTRHRTKSNFNTPLFNHSKTQKFYLHQVIPIWNSLPNSLKNCTSKFTLKKN